MSIPEKYKHINFKPPESVANEAATGLEWRKKNKGKGGLSSSQSKKEGVGSGVQRAVNLKNRNTLSPSTVRRMKAFFDRHEKNKDVEKGKSPWEDRGAIAWKLWGGNSGRSWANKVCKQMDAADKKSKRAMQYIGGLQKIAHEHEDYMAVQNMKKVLEQAEDVCHVLSELKDDGKRLDDWLEDKISKLCDDMDEVFSYLMYGDTDSHDHLDGGLADSKNESDFDKEQLHNGMLVELEHTKDIEIAKEIAMDHLSEDPEYYKKLNLMESSY